jgi:hypothetical protein
MAGNAVQHNSTGEMDKGLFQGVCIQPVQQTGLADYNRQTNEDPQKSQTPFSIAAISQR